MSATMVLHIWITLLLDCRLELNIHWIELCCLCVLCKIYTLSICPYVVSSNFLVHFLELYFSERIYDNLTKKYGWHFFGGHFELLAAILIFSYK